METYHSETIQQEKKKTVTFYKKTKLSIVQTTPRSANIEDILEILLQKEKTIKKMKCGKAPGEDNIHIEFLNERGTLVYKHSSGYLDCI